jgi:hypothetical protein
VTSESESGIDRGVERQVERWLRAKGLPYFVPPRVWGDRLAARIAPFLVFLLLTDVVLSGVVRVQFAIDEDSATITLFFLALVLLLALAIVAVPIALALASAALLRRYPNAALPTAVVLFALCVVATPVVSWLTGSGLDVWAALVFNLIAVLVAALLTWVGVGSLLGSAVRTAVRQLAAIGTLTTRALPILMLVVVFAFFSRPLWEVTSTMSPARLFAVGVFFVVLGLLFALPITRSEMRALDESISPADRIRSVREAGLPQLEARASTAGPPLGRLERLNIETVFVLALGFQVLIFAVLTCVFLLVLGGLAFSAEVLEEWVGSRATTITLFGIEVPFTWALVKTAIFLSCVSSLNFLVSVTTNRGYRTTFYEPLFHQARTALSVRAAYRGPGGAAATGAHPPGAGTAAAAAAAAAADDDDDDEESELLGIPEPGMVEPGRGSE